MTLHVITIICRKYGRYSEMTVKQFDPFTPDEVKQVYNYALHYWDCDDLHLTILPTKEETSNG